MPLAQGRINEIVKRHRPRGWRVAQSRYRWDWSSAQADPNKRTLYVPTLKDDDSLFLYLHEVGHIVRRHWNVNLSKHREEFEAEHFAIHVFKTEGIPITNIIIRDVKYRLREHIKADRKRGVPIERHIARWVNRKVKNCGRKSG
jgi:hypothetical protein